MPCSCESSCPVRQHVAALWIVDEANEAESWAKLQGDAAAAIRDPSFMLKPPPPGSSFDVRLCYFFAGVLYTASYTACDGKRTPEERDACRAEAYTLYCEAIDLCVPE